jgi:EAL domain-containing protein (putative c-di-GMP-specific phosphodiesterase class I)
MIGSRADLVGFDDVVRTRTVHTVFQPLIDLRHGETVGYEALGRGPAGTHWESPAALFGEAYRTGSVAELDWALRAKALQTAVTADLDPALSLFVNVEPVSVRTACPADLRGAIDAGEARLRLVMEVTERAVAADPAGLLAAVARARDAGWGIALDDVGAEPASLAMMPFIRPDVIKLDLRLIQDRTTGDIARVVNAVLAQSERTGATILAEGIETPHHADVARSMGATLGQGWLYGRPGPLPATSPTPQHPLLSRPITTPDPPTPYEAIAAHRTASRAGKALLLPMSMHLEHKGLDATEPTVLLACFQHVRHFTPATRARFAKLAGVGTFTAALGQGMPVRPVDGVLGGALAPDDPLRDEWDVITIGPHFAGALVARDLGDTGPDAQRRFDFVITHDRDLVIQAAQSLLSRVIPTSTVPF